MRREMFVITGLRVAANGGASRRSKLHPSAANRACSGKRRERPTPLTLHELQLVVAVPGKLPRRSQDDRQRLVAVPCVFACLDPTG